MGRTNVYKNSFNLISLFVFRIFSKWQRLSANLLFKLKQEWNNRRFSFLHQCLFNIFKSVFFKIWTSFFKMFRILLNPVRVRLPQNITNRQSDLWPRTPSSTDWPGTCRCRCHGNTPPPRSGSWRGWRRCCAAPCC